ncbi:MAG: hypothetical protein HQ568_12260, partial [Calditrichaeota bacterium]|nr:hypothetical protein [Calditrichota bacterium]
MEENQRELATSRLLDIIRKSGASPPTDEKKVEAPKADESGESTESDSVEKPSLSEAEALPSKPEESPPPPPSLLDIVGKQDKQEYEVEEEEPSELDKLLSEKQPAEDDSEAEEKETPEVTASEDIEIDSDLPVVESLPVRFLDNAKKSLSELTSNLTKKLPDPIKQKLFNKTETEPVSVDTPSRDTKEDKIKLVGFKRKIKGKRVYAIDIGTSSVKVIELVKGSTSASIVDVGIYHFPLKLQYEEDEGVDLLISKAIRELLPASEIKNANLHLLLSDRSVYLKRLEIPHGDTKERLNAIKFQINKDLPFPLEICEIVYRGWDHRKAGKQ